MAAFRWSSHPEAQAEFARYHHTVADPRGWLAGAATDEIATLCSLLPGAAKDVELIPGCTVLELLDGPGSAEATANRAVSRQSLRSRGSQGCVAGGFYNLP